MPRIKSAIKRVEITKRNNERNKSWKSAIRTVSTAVTKAGKTGDAKTSAQALESAYSVIDRAVAKGIVHKNTAARKKSRLAHSLTSSK